MCIPLPSIVFNLQSFLCCPAKLHWIWLVTSDACSFQDFPFSSSDLYHQDVLALYSLLLYRVLYSLLVHWKYCSFYRWRSFSFLFSFTSLSSRSDVHCHQYLFCHFLYCFISSHYLQSFQPILNSILWFISPPSRLSKPLYNSLFILCSLSSPTHSVTLSDMQTLYCWSIYRAS